MSGRVRLNRTVTVNLSERQYRALRRFTTAVDASMGGYLRTIAVSTIPASYWDADEPPPGQLSLVEGEA